jgi:hypothetical protein
MYKNYGILGLFLLLVAFLLLKPRVILNIYNNILGRVVLIGLVLFFTTCNVALGLLSALCLIIVSNMFFMEGVNMEGVNMEGLTNLNNEPDLMIKPGLTIGDDNVTTSNDTNDKLIVTTKAKENERTISDLKAQAETTGVDRQSIQESIQAKSSKTIPVDKTNFESTEVKPSDPLTKSVTEGFSYYGSYKRR